MKPCIQHDRVHCEQCKCTVHNVTDCHKTDCIREKHYSLSSPKISDKNKSKEKSEPVRTSTPIPDNPEHSASQSQSNPNPTLIEIENKNTNNDGSDEKDDKMDYTEASLKRNKNEDPNSPISDIESHKSNTGNKKPALESTTLPENQRKGNKRKRTKLIHIKLIRTRMMASLYLRVPLLSQKRPQQAAQEEEAVLEEETQGHPPHPVTEVLQEPEAPRSQKKRKKKPRITNLHQTRLIKTLKNLLTNQNLRISPLNLFLDTLLLPVNFLGQSYKKCY